MLEIAEEGQEDSQNKSTNSHNPCYLPLAWQTAAREAASLGFKPTVRERSERTESFARSLGAVKRKVD